MNVARHRLSQPVYEGLPWVYLICGVLALIASYSQPSTAWSLMLGLPGLFALMAGVVLILRRRDYRRLRAEYAAPDALDKAMAGLTALPDTRAPHENA